MPVRAEVRRLCRTGRRATARCVYPAEEPGTYLAWLADSNASSEPAARFYQSTLPYLLTTGPQIADDWADLTDGSLDNILKWNEFGVEITSDDIWTNVTTDGTANVGPHCTDWTATAGDGQRGCRLADSRWTECHISTPFNACTGSKYLYCFQQ